MELVIRWRLAPTVENRLAIPEPFRPTPLQYTYFDHPIVIDLINWPILRDQLILNHQNVDLDQIVSNVVHNTVIDVPQMQMSLNVLDLFVNKVLPQMKSPSVSTFCPLGREDLKLMFQIHQGSASPIPISEEIETAMAGQRMQSMQRTFDAVPSQISRPRIPKSPLSSQIGIDRLCDWKLSSEFCKQYPFLDCESCESASRSTTFCNHLTC